MATCLAMASLVLRDCIRTRCEEWTDSGRDDLQPAAPRRICARCVTVGRALRIHAHGRAKRGERMWGHVVFFRARVVYAWVHAAGGGGQQKRAGGAIPLTIQISYGESQVWNEGLSARLYTAT